MHEEESLPHLYGHQFNLPPELFLLDCIFFIVESDKINIQTWKERIEVYGGEVENVYCARVTHVLCRTQRNVVVMRAIRDLKRCVTPHWLNDTIINKQMAPPFQLLHLPLPSIFGMKPQPVYKHIIAVSGFRTEARDRIKEMILESGATFTENLSRNNSVLICKKMVGCKFERARKWNIPIVSTVWLTDILHGHRPNQISQYELPEYQQYDLANPFGINHVLLAYLMGKHKQSLIVQQTRLFVCLTKIVLILINQII